MSSSGWPLPAPRGLAGPMFVVTDAWLREVPPGAATLAAYMTIHNRSEQDRALVSVDSDCFDRVMLNPSLTENGVARMMPEERFVIPAHSSLRLEPGGSHLTMPAPDKRLVSGDSAGSVLHFETGETLKVDAPLRRAETP
jgi:periplasmic copper chaperone A